MSPDEVVIFFVLCQFGRKVSEQRIQAYKGVRMDWNGTMWYSLCCGLSLIYSFQNTLQRQCFK